MELYSRWRSSASFRVRLVLAYKNIDHTVVPLVLSGNNQISAEYRNLNPMNQVPTLIVSDDLKIAQSMAIIYYLEQVYPEPLLIPQDPILSSRAIEIAEIVNSGIQPMQNKTLLGKVEQIGADVKLWAEEPMVKGFSAIEKLVESNLFCVGNSVTIADILLLPQVYNALNYFEIDMSLYPKVLGIFQNVSEIPELQKAFPKNQTDFPEELK